MNNNFQPYKQSSLKTDLSLLVSSLVNNNLLLLVASFLAFLSFGDFGRGGVRGEELVLVGGDHGNL